jgi:hypothetical protein
VIDQIRAAPADTYKYMLIHFPGTVYRIIKNCGRQINNRQADPFAGSNVQEVMVQG